MFTFAECKSCGFVHFARKCRVPYILGVLFRFVFFNYYEDQFVNKIHLSGSNLYIEKHIGLTP